MAQVTVGHYQGSIGRTTTATALTVRMRRTGLVALAAARRIASTAFHARARSRTTRRAGLHLVAMTHQLRGGACLVLKLFKGFGSRTSS